MKIFEKKTRTFFSLFSTYSKKRHNYIWAFSMGSGRVRGVGGTNRRLRGFYPNSPQYLLGKMVTCLLVTQQ